MATCPTCRERYADDVTSCTKDGATLVPDAVVSAADAPLQAGEQVGEYRIEAKIGEGGFGAVYRAVHPVIGKTAAVKVLHRQFSTSPQIVSRFIAEAKAVNQIRHKNIIDIFSFGALADGRQYYVMELLEGASFEHTIRQRGRFPIEEAVPILRAIGRALDAAHAAGIVHRDLKPENIFLLHDDDGVPTPKLLDFGIAKLLGDSELGHKTRTGTPMGTPYYMSPEQAHGRSVDLRSDIYSFGVMTHQALTGCLPFTGDSVMDVLFKHSNAKPPRLSEVCPDLPASLDEPVLRMLAKDPGDRPATVMEAVDGLAKAANEAGFTVPIAARAGISGPTPAVRPSDRGVVITPSGSAESDTLAQARTIAGSQPSIGDAGTSLSPKTSTRTLVLGAAAVLAALAGAAVVFAVVLRDPPVAGAGTTSATAAPLPSPTLTAAPNVIPSPAQTVAPSASGTSDPAQAADVDVQVESTPPDVDVYRAADKIGTSSAPLKLKRGEKVKLTFKAPGFVPLDVEIVPTPGAIIPVKLVKAKAAAGKKSSEVQW